MVFRGLSYDIGVAGVQVDRLPYPLKGDVEMLCQLYFVQHLGGMHAEYVGADDFPLLVQDDLAHAEFFDVRACPVNLAVIEAEYLDRIAVGSPRFLFREASVRQFRIGEGTPDHLAVIGPPLYRQKRVGAGEYRLVFRHVAETIRPGNVAAGVDVVRCGPQPFVHLDAVVVAADSRFFEVEPVHVWFSPRGDKDALRGDVFALPILSFHAEGYPRCVTRQFHRFGRGYDVQPLAPHPACKHVRKLPILPEKYPVEHFHHCGLNTQPVEGRRPTSPTTRCSPSTRCRARWWFSAAAPSG